MKTMYDVELEVGDCLFHAEYAVIAPNMPQAIAKGIKQAQKMHKRKTGWRCIAARERKLRVVS